MKSGFDTLNEEQQKAVTSQASRILVLAGAGSGKTKTLLQKIIYLIKDKGVSPSSILAITYTKNAANEMIDRLIISTDSTGEYEAILAAKNIRVLEKENHRKLWKSKVPWLKGLNVRTFHGFCYSVLRDYGVSEFDNRFKLISEEKSNEEEEFSKYMASERIYDVFYKMVIELCEDPEYLLQLKRYIIDHFVDKVYKSKSTYSKYDKNFTSLNGTKVRSKSEQSIADWFYRHNIPFEYEPELQVSDFTFHPDFYIPAANLYIEHISDVSYPTKDKEKEFIKGGIHFAKTFENQTKDSHELNLALDSILKGKLPTNYHKEVQLNFHEEFKTYLKEVKEFINTVMRVMDMIKVENLSEADIKTKASKDSHERVRDLYNLGFPLIARVKNYCINRSYLDFNDLVLRCISLFQNNDEVARLYRERFKYILVDEFQDVNNLQVDLLKLIITNESQLFCVGDDWQSIYGFRGSNVSYIIEFEKHFPDSKVFKLDLNYRSTDQIVGASNEVIRHNKFKIDKNIKATKSSEHKIVVFAGNDEKENVNFVVDTVKKLLDEGLSGEDILILYRRTRMIGLVENESTYRGAFSKKGFKIQAKTIHAAKGLEAKVVFIIGLTEGSGGFPDIWMHDRVFQIIKETKHDQLMEEERRLFYVALTRAKDKLYLITEKGNESSFLNEIPEMYTVKSVNDSFPLIDKKPTCKKCFSELEKLWKVCPYCGEPRAAE